MGLSGCIRRASISPHSHHANVQRFGFECHLGCGIVDNGCLRHLEIMIPFSDPNMACRIHHSCWQLQPTRLDPHLMLRCLAALKLVPFDASNFRSRVFFVMDFLSSTVFIVNLSGFPLHQVMFILVRLGRYSKNFTSFDLDFPITSVSIPGICQCVVTRCKADCSRDCVEIVCSLLASILIWLGDGEDPAPKPTVRYL